MVATVLLTVFIILKYFESDMHKLVPTLLLAGAVNSPLMLEALTGDASCELSFKVIISLFLINIKPLVPFLIFRKNS